MYDKFWDDDDVPDFRLPTILECQRIIPPSETVFIERAAIAAHEGRETAAKRMRRLGGYGGCDG